MERYSVVLRCVRNRPKQNLRLLSLSSRSLTGQSGGSNSGIRNGKPSFSRSLSSSNGKSRFPQTHQPELNQQQQFANFNSSSNSSSSSANQRTSEDASDERPLSVHKNSLDDLEKYVGREQADRLRADLCENEDTGAQAFSERTNRERKYSGVVKFWSNYIPSNSPCEDRRIGSKNAVVKHNSRSKAKLPTNEISFMFGILDGHGGGWCADVVSKRIGDYFMVTQVPPDAISNYIAMANTQISNTTFKAKKVPYQIRNILTDRVLSERTFELLNAKHKDYQPYWRESLIEFSRDVQHRDVDVKDTAKSLKTAITRLDQDMAKEAYKYASQLSLHYSKPHADVFKKSACSGCVGTLAVIKQGVCTIAQLGDTRALIGEQDSTGQWKAVRVTPEHTLQNQAEVERIQTEHPEEEVIFKERVLGVLQPSRAFGDNRLKQPVNWIEEIFEGDPVIRNPVYQDYLTPPYVSNEPELVRVPIKKNTKFLVMASDGFWEQYEKLASPYKKSPETFTAMDEDDSLEDLASQRLHTKIVEQKIVEEIGRHLEIADEMESLDEESREHLRSLHGVENNLATESIKKALMIGDYGDSDKFYLCDMMNLRAEERRRRRDDITVTIVKFG